MTLTTLFCARLKRRFLTGLVCPLLIPAAAVPLAADDDDDDNLKAWDQPVEELFQTEMVYPQEKGEWQIT